MFVASITKYVDLVCTPLHNEPKIPGHPRRQTWTSWRTSRRHPRPAGQPEKPGKEHRSSQTLADVTVGCRTSKTQGCLIFCLPKNMSFCGVGKKSDYKPKKGKREGKSGKRERKRRKKEKILFKNERTRLIHIQLIRIQLQNSWGNQIQLSFRPI